MSAGLRFGANATLNLNGGTYGAPSWSPITCIGDVTLNLAYDEADASTRGANSTKATEPTLLDLSIEFDMLEDTSNASYLSLRTAFFAKAQVDVQASTGAATTTGELWVRAVYKVTGFKKGEPLNGINKFTVTIKPCYSANPPTNGTN